MLNGLIIKPQHDPVNEATTIETLLHPKKRAEIKFRNSQKHFSNDSIKINTRHTKLTYIR